MTKLILFAAFLSSVHAQVPFSFVKWHVPAPPAFVDIKIVTSCGTTFTFNKPTALAVGDLMVVVTGIDSTSAFTPPAGWTERQAGDVDGYESTLFTKLADAADVAAANFIFTKPHSTCDNVGFLAAYTNVSPSAPVAFATALNGTGSSCTHQGGTAAVGNSMFATYCTSFSTPNAPAGFTSRGSAWSSRYSDKVLTAAGPTGNFTSTGGSSKWVTLSLVISGKP